MKRIAVIGLGKMGLLHASLLNTIPGVKLVAVCEKSGLIRRFSKNIFSGVAIVEKVSHLSAYNIDAAYITTPPSSHCAIANTLFSERICRHIFVEKPLANNLVESNELNNLPGKLGIDSINMVGYNRRFGVTFKKAKELIEEGALGELVSFEGYAFSSDFQSSGNSRNNAGRGGVIKDLGSHAIDLMLWYLGDISIKSVVNSQKSTSGVIDSASFRVSTGKGLQGQFRVSWIEPHYRLPEIGFIMEGTKGLTLIVNDDKIELRNKDGKGTVWHKHDLNDTVNFMLGGTDYLREDEAFINAITSEKTIKPNFNTALKVDEIIHHMEKQIIGH
ncbi:Gfo/Idh/MocA family oxidoreductase [bacterium]|nr:Gfo/Idh/MocA family oxidoreductase [bacterium]